MILSTVISDQTEDDWRDAPPANDFFRRLGPLQRKWTNGRWSYALRVEDWHRNGAGFMHGGAMTALIDEVAGTIVSDAVGRRHVTLQLSTAFLKPVEVGDLVETSCEIVRVTHSMTFAEARLRVADDVVATASLIFKAVRAQA